MSSQLQCHRCGYAWEYSGSLQQATCPNCAAKVRVEDNRLGESLEELAEEYDLTVDELRELIRRLRAGER